MIRPCPTAVKCFPCADGNPFANLSAEDPDTNLFLSVQFSRLPNPPPNNWNQVSCVGFCESTISQVDADDCARRQAFECILDGQPPPNPDNPSWPTPFYCNQAATFQSGSSCYTIAAGTVCHFSQMEANALAESLGNHRVHDSSLTSPCPPVISPPLAPDEDEDCPAETGTAAPDSLEIASQVTWETHEIDNDSITPFVSSNPACNPTSYDIYVPVAPLDHPPGNYGLEYLGGHVHYGAPFCLDVPGFPYDAEASVYALQNEAHNVDVPIECDQRTYLANSFFPGGGSGWTGCFADEDAAIADINANLIGKVFRANPYPPDEVDAFPHDNDGGDFSLLFQDYIQLGAMFPDGPLRFQVVQIEGLIPQPRKVAIADYAALITQFADPAAAASWDGSFPERTVYTSMTVQWAVTAAGSFGGAVLRFTDAHPTSVSGKGWMLEIFSAGAILMYRAFKAVGNTSAGIYYKDSTSTPDGPACCTVLDSSETVWYPGETAP